MTKRYLSRRAFLAGSAVSMTLAHMGSVAHASSEKKEPQWDEVFDVIVIGSGLAGMCAALSARKNGCKNVVVIEKMSYLGGNSAIATGDFGAVGSMLTKKQGIKDSPEAFAADISAACGGLNHQDLPSPWPATPAEPSIFSLKTAQSSMKRPSCSAAIPRPACIRAWKASAPA